MPVSLAGAITTEVEDLYVVVQANPTAGLVLGHVIKHDFTLDAAGNRQIEVWRDVTSNTILTPVQAANIDVENNLSPTMGSEATTGPDTEWLDAIAYDGTHLWSQQSTTTTSGTTLQWVNQTTGATSPTQPVGSQLIADVGFKDWEVVTTTGTLTANQRVREYLFQGRPSIWFNLDTQTAIATGDEPAYTNLREGPVQDVDTQALIVTEQTVLPLSTKLTQYSHPASRWRVSNVGCRRKYERVRR